MIEKTKIEASVREILLALGQDITKPSIVDTPKRVADMYLDIFSGMYADPLEVLSFFDEELGNSQKDMIIAKEISFFSICEHHMVPFFGKVHIGYIPAPSKLLGISALARLVEIYSKRPQIQERITNQLSTILDKEAQALGVAVIIEAEHLCMTMRGVKQVGSKIKTTSFKGVFHTDLSLQQQFLTLLKE
jgi:GTP cyclohydrolase I